MTNKEKYIQFTDLNPSLPLFLQPWWLEAAMDGEGDWDAVLTEENGEITGALPYCFKKRLGITNLFIPWCTAYLSAYPANTISTKLLIQQLPVAADYRFRLFPETDPSDWGTAGFTSYENKSHLVRSSDLEKFNDCILPAAFRQIRKAEKIISVSLSERMEPAYSLWEKNMNRKKATSSLVPKHVMESIDRALAIYEQRQIWEARDEEGNLHAAIYIAFDKLYAYYLWGGYDQAYKASGATSLLFYNAIRDAIASGKTFDFEGSMVESVSRFYKGFGAVEAPVYAVHKTPSILGKIIKRGK